MKIERVGDIDFLAETKDDLICQIQVELEKKRGFILSTPNIDFFSKIAIEPQLGELLKSSDFLVCDSQPISLLSRLIGSDIPKISGSDLIFDLLKLCSDLEIGVAFLGGDPKSAFYIEKKVENLFSNIPNLLVDSRMIDDNDWLELSSISEKLARSKTGMVFVGYGFPKQEKVAQTLKKQNPNISFICIGMGIKYFTGEMKRSPRFLSNIGAEWIWRLLNEPRRLFKRYLIRGIPTFLKIGVKELAKKWSK